ncbi:hypothetical protein L210DRAFT_3507615 [Boletus edulis BED1]|uniref:Uncharacterized protein n=1 Tax=Boletus edulis BED1 TaxID=1328754 RepID=A0AAD4G9J9_BOLED|nr:hypothetical protein L210DRAFT_3507615 [Boletus edulis BED1]
MEHPTHKNEAVSGSAHDVGAGSTVADVDQAVRNVTGHQGILAVTWVGTGTITQPDQSQAAQSPSNMQPQESSLKPSKLVKKPKSKCKEKMDMSKADHMPSQGPVIVSKLMGGDPILAAGKGEIESRCCNSAAIPGPSKASLVKVGDWHPTLQPSNISKDQQKNILEPDEQAVPSRARSSQERPTIEVGNEAESTFLQQPNAHTLQASSNGQSKNWELDIPMEKLTAPDKMIWQIVMQGKKSADVSKNLDATSGQASEQRDLPMKWNIEDKPVTPLIKIPKDKNPDVSPEKRISKKQKKELGPRVGNFERTLPAEKLNRAQGSPTKWDIEDKSATPPKNIPKNKSPDVSPEKRISQK